MLMGIGIGVVATLLVGSIVKLYIDVHQLKKKPMTVNVSYETEEPEGYILG